ncbi:glyoxylase-like metal-dependent hydrolase (beta-lactamase superfamily II) [Haloactinopolyspora alba]|uniref:Glyoxylase-like metal-dependent hydrolase (Beta-lactamase superfamily II) n=1 Tax=Haloactinopolyspora alba TaxID=648780 RepID=A0A2P8DIA1_9ACTN|nr:MBL fold metallo-hydrolase [Haloactinopolyspora alba]PSK96928.1 glyoxylase-like metal-dependent hydrolase (beta-lactamase superfamily II) [Haloactinopolyspora alba]
MLLHSLTAPVLGTNCYVLAPDGGRQCVLVDPGIAVDEQVDALLAEHLLEPVAALVTHGHVDHTFALAQLCQRRDLPVYLHEADAYRLADPIGTLGPDLAPMLAALADDWVEPPDVRTFSDGSPLWLAGIRIEPVHSPGHTEGSTLYHVPSQDGSDGSMCFTGDVLFAGTIGRTDLPGGDDERMRHTLGELARPEADGGLADATTVLPGHGESSTLGQERTTNPYLRQLGP